MNREAKMRKMRYEGATYAEIGKAFGLSKQRAYQIIGGVVTPRYYRPFPAEKCKYPMLLCWLNNNKVSLAELSRRMFGNANSNNIGSLYRYFSGERDIRKKYIDKLLKITGLSYEILFAEE